MERASGQGRGNAIMKLMVVVVVVMVGMKGALATNYKVGDDAGWTIMSYDSWVAGKTFNQGDTLEFDYTSAHDVVEVNEANYGACAQGSNTIYTNSPTTYNLTTVGPKYYICTVSTHCTQGMKVSITVVAAATTPSSSPTTPSTTPTTPSNSTTPPNSSPLFLPPSIFSLFLILGFTLFSFHSS